LTAEWKLTLDVVGVLKDDENRNNGVVRDLKQEVEGKIANVAIEQ
jgi:hypothetical protein